MEPTFIVLDGTDGSGKTTQFNLLLKRLASNRIATGTVDFPQYGTPSAYFVEKYLNGDYGSLEEVGPKVASLFYALDRFDAKADIQQDLDEGRVLISNRYVTASMGHQAGKISDATERADYVQWLDHLEYSILGLPRPSLQIILSVPAEVSQELVAKKEARSYTQKTHDLHEANLEHLRDAERAYRELAERDASIQLLECAPGGTLRSIEEIHEELWERVEAHLEQQHVLTARQQEAVAV